MRILTRRTRVSRRVTASAAGIAMLLAGGIGLSAPAADASATCPWLDISPINGWGSANPYYSTGIPRICLDNGFVYMGGALVQSNGYTNPQFATLPPGWRPTTNVYLTVYTRDGIPGTLTIYANGQIFAAGGNARDLVSFSGISFPAAGTAWPADPLALENGWQTADTIYNTGTAGYVDLDGIVHL